MLQTSKITKPISIITLSVLLSLCVRSTLSIPMRPSSREVTSLSNNKPVPSPGDGASSEPDFKLEVETKESGRDITGCTEEQVLCSPLY